jgi:SAM-dependent methyltransferase
MNQTDNPQAVLWNGPAGRAWVESQALLDRLFTPFEALLVDAVAEREARHVLDVGCGTGATTLAVARLLDAGGSCTGLDISEPMIAAARVRAEREGLPARFLCADAQTHAFEPASVDLIVSRFGVMFFDDPIRAFSNLWRATTPDGAIRFIAWRSAAENPFMTAAERAAAPLLPDLPPRRPDVPGQFAFADGERVARILDASGWVDVDVRPLDVACTLSEADLRAYVARVGPVGMALQDADAETRARVLDAILPAFDPYVVGAEVRFTAACWLVGGQASALT